MQEKLEKLFHDIFPLHKDSVMWDFLLFNYNYFWNLFNRGHVKLQQQLTYSQWVERYFFASIHYFIC